MKGVWRSGDAEDFLELNEKERAEVDKRLAEIEHRRNVQGPCTCGEPEVARCDVCRGPSCSEDSIVTCCCECWNKAAT